VTPLWSTLFIKARGKQRGFCPVVVAHPLDWTRVSGDLSTHKNWVVKTNFVLFFVFVFCSCVYWGTGTCFDSVRRFGATLLLRTTWICFWGNWVDSRVAVLQIKNQNAESRNHSTPEGFHGVWTCPVGGGTDPLRRVGDYRPLRRDRRGVGCVHPPPLQTAPVTPRYGSNPYPTTPTGRVRNTSYSYFVSKPLRDKSFRDSCSRLAPTASYTWFHNLIVWLYLFLQFESPSWWNIFVQIHDGTTLLKAKFGTTPQKIPKNDLNCGVGSSFGTNKTPPSKLTVSEVALSFAFMCSEICFTKTEWVQ